MSERCQGFLFWLCFSIIRQFHFKTVSVDDTLITMVLFVLAVNYGRSMAAVMNEGNSKTLILVASSL